MTKGLLVCFHFVCPDPFAFFLLSFIGFNRLDERVDLGKGDC